MGFYLYIDRIITMKTFRIHNTADEIQVGTIYCLGRNYAEHAKEMKAEAPSSPIIFLKPSSSILNNEEDIIRPSISQSLHHEVEFIIAIGKSGKNISEQHAKDHILGYGVGLDMTLRDVQEDAKKKGLPWSIAKGFHTSAPISDIIPASKILDTNNLEIRCKVNGSIRQQTKISKMIFPIEKIISYISSLFAIERGDLIFTGTPEGVSEVKNGDSIVAELVDWIQISHRVKTA